MPVYELYSRRKRRAESEGDPEVYQYDKIPERLRTQIRQFFSAAIGAYRQISPYATYEPANNNKDWHTLANTLRREFGLDRLSRGDTPYEEIMIFIQSADTDDVLSVVELGARWIASRMSTVESFKYEGLGVTQPAQDALDELNYRFRDAGVGYEFVGGEIIRVDSQLIHAEVVKNALSFLGDPRFKGPEEEFLEAHRHYRNGDTKEAITGANRAFESTMKTICGLKGWAYEEKARASDLIKVLKANSLFPDYLGTSFDQLLATLASGLPQVRNNAGGHGQGPVPRPIPTYVAAYALHLAATKIVFLVDAALSDSRR
jgi:hypothetical protein